MHRWQGSAWKARSRAALLTLAAHGFFALLLIQTRQPLRESAVTREIVSIPITLLPLPVTPADEEIIEPASAPRTGERARAAPPAPVAPRPDTAITLPAPEVPVPPPATPGNVDWFAQSEEFAARYAEEAESPKVFGKPLEKMREPCKPRKSTFEWKSDSKSTGSASLTLGWEEPEPNKHLFDDMMAGRRSKSSVPDPNECD